MTCDAIRERLSERLDAELGASAQVQVEQHLAACGACRHVASTLASMLEDLALLADVEIPGALAERMAARVPPPSAFRAGRGDGGHELRRVAGWAIVMITMSLMLVNRGFTGRLADGLAPVLAEARQQVLKSDLRGENLLARLDTGAEQGLERLTAAALHRER